MIQCGKLLPHTNTGKKYCLFTWLLRIQSGKKSANIIMITLEFAGK